jgi:membrane protease YdiL (CAAX protease family)
LEFCVAALVHNPYRVNAAFHFNDFIKTFGYILRAVAYEELVFRGALLYILMHKLDGHKAVIVSAVCFGIYHWFSWQAWGNPVQMGIIFFKTATAGYLLALAFLRTRSMYLGFALHFGIDLASMLIFSKDKGIGLQLLVKSFEKDPVVPAPVISVPILIIYAIGFQVLTYLLFFRSNRANGDGS